MKLDLTKAEMVSLGRALEGAEDKLAGVGAHGEAAAVMAARYVFREGVAMADALEGATTLANLAAPDKPKRGRPPKAATPPPAANLLPGTEGAE